MSGFIALAPFITPVININCFGCPFVTEVLIRVSMKHYLSKPPFIALVAIIIADSLFFGLTDPKELGSAMLILGFSLVVTTLFLATRVMRIILQRWSPALARHKHLDVCITGLVCASLGLQSIGQMTGRDFMVLLLSAAAMYWYVNYQKRQPVPARD
jgi:hypothetical protein